MRRLRNVKIVATLGPSSETYETIRALHEAGADAVVSEVERRFVAEPAASWWWTATQAAQRKPLSC